MVVFQRQPNGPEPLPFQLANHNMTGNDFYQQGEEFMSYKSVLHLEDHLKSFFIQVRLNKSGFKKIMSQHVVLISMENHENASLRCNRITISRSKCESVSSWMERIQHNALSRVTRK